MLSNLFTYSNLTLSGDHLGLRYIVNFLFSTLYKIMKKIIDEHLNKQAPSNGQVSNKIMGALIRGQCTL